VNFDLKNGKKLRLLRLTFLYHFQYRWDLGRLYIPNLLHSEQVMFTALFCTENVNLVLQNGKLFVCSDWHSFTILSWLNVWANRMSEPSECLSRLRGLALWAEWLSKQTECLSRMTVCAYCLSLSTGCLSRLSVWDYWLSEPSDSLSSLTVWAD
jgi:hypothetical protein